MLKVLIFINELNGVSRRLKLSIVFNGRLEARPTYLTFMDTTNELFINIVNITI